MDAPGTLEFDGLCLQLAGDWSLSQYPRLQAQLAARTPPSTPVQIDCRALGRLDTAGASLLADWLGEAGLQLLIEQADGLGEERRALLRCLAEARSASTLEPARRPAHSLLEPLVNLGHASQQLLSQMRELLAFTGLTLSALASQLWQPSRWRITSLVAHIEQCGLNAVPIIALLTFMVGAVVAFLGATVLANFGATLYTVHLVAFSFLREFGVLLTAILMAGRTASAFTAQIGAMKANEEIDAIRVQGLDPMQLLVLPRLLALLVSLPILSFIAVLAGMAGGAAVSTLMLDISPTLFLGILQEDVALRHFWVGLAKAPLFAFIIAIIGCLQGFKAGNSARSVGEHTTSAVVQSIFLVILIDALAAMFCMEMGW